MREASKAMARRAKDKVFPWRTVFSGHALDIGCGDDVISNEFFPALKSVRGFDTQDGDANNIDSYFEPETFHVIHGSQVLEHLHDPYDAIKRMLKILKKGGHIVMTIPDWVAYEGMIWPSAYNLDHKSSWSMIYRGSIAPIHIHIPTFLASFESDAETRLAHFVDTNYCYKTGVKRDQTFNYQDGVECWNEFVLRKK